MRAEFPATYTLETRDWKGAEALTPPAGAPVYYQAATYWARAVGAGHLRDANAAAAALKQYDAMVEATSTSDKPFLAKSMETDRDEAAAWLAFAEAKNGEAVELLRKVANKQDAVGKGEVELPAREMLADMLLEMNRPQDALAEYQRSMKIDPNRFNGLAGAARAAELSNQLAEASQYYAQLLKKCAGSDSDRPELQRAKSLLAQNGAASR
jgi:tetratricopeptide (TPR) repeat protein